MSEIAARSVGTASAHGIKLPVGREIDANRADPDTWEVGAPADQPGVQLGVAVVVGVAVGVGDPHGWSEAVNFWPVATGGFVHRWCRTRTG